MQKASISLFSFEDTFLNEGLRARLLAGDPKLAKEKFPDLVQQGARISKEQILGYCTEITCLLTSHDNPEWIANFFSELVGEELENSKKCFKKIAIEGPHEITTLNIATKAYRFDKGAWIYIFYIPESWSSLYRNQHLKDLKGKNSHIDAAHQILSAKYSFLTKPTFYYYDSLEQNLEAAKALERLPLLRCRITSPNLPFKIEKAYLPTSKNLNLHQAQNELHAISNFYKSLNNINRKAQEHGAYKDKDHQDAKDAAQSLHDNIHSLYSKTIEEPPHPNYQKFMRDSSKFIHTSLDTLNNHRGWKNFTANLGLAIAGLGIIYGIAFFIHRIKDRQWGFKLCRTDSEILVNQLDNSIQDLYQTFGG